MRQLIRVVFLVLASLTLPSRQKDSSPEKTTIVEGNHYFSNYEVNITYKIDKVNVHKPIILILKKKEDNSVFDNNLNVTLRSGPAAASCLFTSFDGMCFLGNFQAPDMALDLRCDHLPCEASWTILQPGAKKVEAGEQALQDFYELEDSQSHVMVMISCNNPQVKGFKDMVKAYSENKFTQGYSHSIIYLLFESSKRGHIYFQVKEEAKSCAHFTLTKPPSLLNAGTDGRDFIQPTVPNSYTFGERPTTQLLLDCSMHQIEQQAIKSTLTVKVVGEKEGAKQTLTAVEVKPPIPIETFEFKIVIGKIPAGYQNLSLQFLSSSKTIVLNYLLSKAELVEVEEAKYYFFSFGAAEALRLKLAAAPDADPSESFAVKAYPPGVYKSTMKSCSKKGGCEILLTSTSMGTGGERPETGSLHITSSDPSKAGSSSSQISYTTFHNKVSHKMRQNEFVYLSRKISKDRVIQVVVNNPNVIIHAASKSVCEVPSDQCYEKIGNIHNPFIYEPKKDDELLFVVEGLENCQFVITVIDEGTKEIELKDSEPFSYLMDDHESALVFKFVLGEKRGVQFNLISSLNELLLIVNNGDEAPNGDENTASTDGYISLTKSELQSREFRILVQKTDISKHKFVHFTLIATTTGSNMRLDTGSPSYETLKTKEFKTFAFEFDKNQDYIVNLYIHNLRKTDVSIPLLLSSKNQWTDSSVSHFTIDSPTDVLNLKDVSKELCQKEGQTQCEIFIRIVNTMDYEIDLTITLLVKDSVVEIKDGIWQTYSGSTIAQTAHFFFLPKTKDSSISIMYRSNIVTMGIAYTVWKSDEKGIDPTLWPFPPYQDQVSSFLSSYSSVNHIQIDHEHLKGCWPNCIILMSLFKKKSDEPDYLLEEDNLGQFSLLIANSFIELPQKTKINVLLKAEEEKYLMVDLKYAMDRESLTFFTNSVIGYYQLFGNVYSEKNPRLPDQFDHDFAFGQIETQIKISSISDKLQEMEMEDDTNIYLCIFTKAYAQTKFSIEVDSEEEIIKLLDFDNFQHVLLRQNEPKLFQLQAFQKYELKFTREKGYFYVKIAVCKEDGKEEDFESCLEDLKDGEDKGEKIVSKTEEFGQEPCSKCIVFVRLETTDQEAQTIIHVQSEYSMIELKENDVVSDFLNEHEENKYSITSMKYEETVISIEVAEGDPVVSVTDYEELEIKKDKNQATNNVHIVIPAKPGFKEEEGQKFLMTPLGGVNYDAFRYSETFRFLVVSIKSKNEKMPVSYTITYSSGERETYLEDGLLTGYTLEANKTTSFLYRNPDRLEGGLLTLSMNSSASIYNLQFHMFTFQDVNDEDTKVEVTPQKPPMRKKTPNPTITYSIPGEPLVRIEVVSKKVEKISLIVNHQELMILPMDMEFPFSLGKGEGLSMLADVNNPGSLTVTIRKCDETAPDFGYTFDREDFEHSVFDSVSNLATDPKFQFIIKAAKIGTLYMQMNSTDDNGLFSLKVHYSDSKVKPEKARAGNNGVLQYQILDSTRALISFSGLVCQGTCPKKVRYYWLANPSLQDVYTQTVCPYSYFQILDIKSVEPLPITEITASANGEGRIQFEYKYPQHISYLSVKAVMNEVEIYYQPVEIITMWGTLTQTGHLYQRLLIIAFSALCLCFCLLQYRRHRKYSSYGRLDQIDV